MAQSPSQATQAVILAKSASNSSNKNEGNQQGLSEGPKQQQLAIEPARQTTQALVPTSSSSQNALASTNSSNGNRETQHDHPQQRAAIEPAGQATKANLPAETSSPNTSASATSDNQIISRQHKQGVVSRPENQQTQNQEVQAQDALVAKRYQNIVPTRSREPSESVLDDFMDCDNEKQRPDTFIQQQNQHYNQEKSDQNRYDSSMDVEPDDSVFVTSDQDAEYQANQMNQTSPDYLNQTQLTDANHYGVANKPDRKFYEKALKKTFNTRQGSITTTAPVGVKKEPISQEYDDTNGDDWIPLSQRGKDRHVDNEDAKVIGWLDGYHRSYLIQYGPRNSAKYKIVPAKQFATDYVAAYDEEITCPDNRFGEQKIRKKFVYGTEHVVDIYGVAWRYGRHVQDPVEMLNPDNEDRPAQYPHTYLLIQWEKDNQREKRWETRTTLRQRWGHTEADYEIYNAACQAQKRYEAFRDNRRAPFDRSPTPGVIAAKAKEMKKRALTQQQTANGNPDEEEQAGRSPSPAGVAHVQFKKPSEQPGRPNLKKEVEDMIEAYCLINGMSRLDLGSSDKTKLLQAYIDYNRTGKLEL